jgi:hypothetical protein
VVDGLVAALASAVVAGEALGDSLAGYGGTLTDGG